MKTTIGGSGIQNGVEAQVDGTHKALRVSLRPPEKGVFGSYSLLLNTGAYAAGALTNSPALAFRWNSPALNCIVRRVRAAISVTTSFVNGVQVVDLIRATKTGSGQYTGGQSFSLAGDDQSLSTRFPTSQQSVNATATGPIAIANGAALTAPATAWTFDSAPLAATVNGVLNGMPTATVMEAMSTSEPLELRSGEGFLLRVTWPATGVPTVWFNIEWDEIDPARYYGLYN